MKTEQHVDTYQIEVFTVVVSATMVDDGVDEIVVRAMVNGVTLTRRVWAEVGYPTIASAMSDEFFNDLIEEAVEYGRYQLKCMADAYALLDAMRGAN